MYMGACWIMGLIAFPSSVLVTRSDLSLANPGQTVLRSIYGSGSQVLGRGPGYWTGRLEIAETDRVSDAARRAMELFLTQLRGAENTFEVPIKRKSAGTLTAGKTLTVSAVSHASGAVEVTVTGAAEGLVAGDYARIGERMYQLATDHSSSKFTIEPPLAPEAGDDVTWEEVTCLARLVSDRTAISSLTPDFGGPWTIEWEEAT